MVFSHGRMTVAIEVAEISLDVVARQIDLALVILAETFRALDRALWCYRHFYGFGALVQVKVNNTVTFHCLYSPLS